MMAQYLEIKDRHRDALLFYRMGDFYEMFFDDAVAAAEALDIALTKRGKHAGDDIPMCGVPVHSSETYLLNLIRKGFRVAVCEQLEDPAEAKKRGSKSVVRRDVVRLVTPGTLTEDSLLDARRHNFLAAYAEIRGDGALAWVDISTGAFHVLPCPRVQLGPELARLGPSEIVICEAQEADPAGFVPEFRDRMTELSRASFDSSSARRRLTGLFGVSSLDAFGAFTLPEVSAMGAIVDYLDITQKGKLPLVRPPVRESLRGTMQIDAATRRNLEISQSLSGGREGSLLTAMDRTVTAAGGRLLERRLSSPSRDVEVIRDRLDAVSFAIDNRRTAERLREELRKVPDMERALSRLGLERGGPRDLAAIRSGLTQAETLAETLSAEPVSTLIRQNMGFLTGHAELIDLLDAALIAEPPLLSRDGGFIAPGFDGDLDECRTLRDEGRGVIASLQQKYAEMTGVTSLKVKHNNVLGYFIETTATHAEKMRALSDTFIHRQTTANQVRFTTLELSELETKIHNAGGRALEIEKRLFETLRVAVLDRAPAINDASKALAELDLTTALADLAVSENWNRPEVDQGREFLVTGGRHPVVERALRKQGGEKFVANSCALSDGGDGAAIWLLTGPNMAGKSTFLRQNALIALIAQAGSYVPAESARIGIVSQLFSRVGASDDLARGRSTFMVEMVETAAILNQADDRALVILDEIGRGTATYDGLSIAWATLEHLHDVNRCRALFATHYHEMTALSDKLVGVENATVSVKEWEGEVIFLHEVVKGKADRSYGVQVARLAGLPPAVVKRARTVLDALEKGQADNAARPKAIIDDLPLFAAQPPAPAPAAPKESAVEKKLAGVSPDELSPREALQLLYDLKALI
ncbi:DNA mismatch repair protein MutS [Celeribacter indicus]|uniref:DNA mismatch repair protein MutS n=1 Tax=Celeribacter indicus TaxID=1208324 RepID=A0A0B5DVZ9_9RHOB|nr:DNA mismatch repair protein MutS [Celeribacter indicus]AJE44936.1 DNA mismatch repair protein MutS [Celeribacter indicus]SDW96860.1 DNA mismatch repair protein MutS [Celeribacter indicus]